MNKQGLLESMLLDEVTFLEQEYIFLIMHLHLCFEDVYTKVQIRKEFWQSHTTNNNLARYTFQIS